MRSLILIYTKYDKSKAEESVERYHLQQQTAHLFLSRRLPENIFHAICLRQAAALHLSMRSLILIYTKYDKSKADYRKEWASLQDIQYWRRVYER